MEVFLMIVIITLLAMPVRGVAVVMRHIPFHVTFTTSIVCLLFIVLTILG